MAAAAETPATQAPPNTTITQPTQNNLNCPVPAKRTSERSTLELNGVPVDARSNDGQIIEDNQIELRENVRITQGERELKADFARIDQATNVLRAEGDVSLREPGIELKGSVLEATLDGSSAKISDAKYRLTDRGIHGSAKEFEANEQGIISLEDATFTSCPEGRTGWDLSASSMELDQNEGWGESTNTVIRLGEVPVFYLPWMTFPIDERRRSGVLMPNIGFDEENGLDLTVPYYFNIAPNFDDTLSPRWIEKRGFMIGNEFRYLTDQHRGEIFAEVLPNDKLVTEGLEDDRWAYQFNHRSQLSKRWFGVIDAAQVSDDVYFNDLGRSVDTSNTNTVTRSGLLGYNDRHWQFSVEAWEADALQTPEIAQPYRKLPDVRLFGHYAKFLGPLSFSVASSAIAFDHLSPDRVIGDRVDIAPTLSMPFEWVWGYFTPAAKYRYTEYELEHTLPVQAPSITREMPIYSLDTGLFFERDTKLFGRDMLQTLEPRVYYLNVPFREQNDIPLFDTTEATASYAQLFRDNRFVGADRQGDADQTSVGVSTRFLSRDGGVEWARISLAQATYFENRQVQLSAVDGVDTRSVSPYFLEASMRFTEDLQLRAMNAYDGESRQSVRSSTAIHYEPDDRHIFNIEHRFRDERNNKAEQGIFSFAWPVSGNWNLVGRYQYDLLNKKDVESLFGVEYESCCWGLRLVTRRYLNTPLDQDGVPIAGSDDYKNNIYFQFVFKGLGGAGSSGLRKLLSESIDGYQDRLTPR